MYAGLAAAALNVVVLGSWDFTPGCHVHRPTGAQKRLNPLMTKQLSGLRPASFGKQLGQRFGFRCSRAASPDMLSTAAAGV